MLCTPQNIQSTPSHIQVGLQLSLARYFKAMKDSSRDLLAQLERVGTPNQFSNILPAKR